MGFKPNRTLTFRNSEEVDIFINRVSKHVNRVGFINCYTLYKYANKLPKNNYLNWGYLESDVDKIYVQPTLDGLYNVEFPRVRYFNKMEVRNGT